MDSNYDTFIKQEFLNGDEDLITSLPSSQLYIPVKNEPITDESAPFVAIKNEPLAEEAFIEENVTVKTENQTNNQITAPADSFIIYELKTPHSMQSQSTQNLQNDKVVGNETSPFISQIRPINTEQPNQVIVNNEPTVETHLHHIPVTNTTNTPPQPAPVSVVLALVTPPPILLNAQLRKRHTVVLPVNPIDKRTRYNIEETTTKKLLTNSPISADRKSSTKLLNKCRSLNAGSKKIINHLIKKKRSNQQSKQKESPNISNNCVPQELMEKALPNVSMVGAPDSLMPTVQAVTSTTQTEQKEKVISSPLTVEFTKSEICLPAKESLPFTSELRVKCLCSLIADNKDTSTHNTELRALFLEMFEETRRLSKKQQRKVKMSLLQAISDAEDLMEQGKCCGF